MFIKMLFDAMPESEESAISGGFGGGVWRSMLHQEYAERVAVQQGFGIAEAIIRQFGDRGAALEPPLSPLVGAAARSSGFGARAHPISGQQHFHNGVDYAAPSGTPVRAILDAEVVFAGPKGGYGNLVELRHAGGTTTLYAHLDSIDVQVGDRIARGSLLGSVGSTGQSTGPHLHFEVRQGDKPIDPEAFLAATPETLLTAR
jgi:murein DD-endopeptidase MepM/ murein hydrolase activator NlpD